jgi:hypothetical protein
MTMDEELKALLTEQMTDRRREVTRRVRRGWRGQLHYTRYWEQEVRSVQMERGGRYELDPAAWHDYDSAAAKHNPIGPVMRGRRRRVIRYG